MRALLKELGERSLAAICVLAMAPLLAGIAVAIVLDSGLPIFFRQQRVGRGGVLFSIWKFRSMRVGRPEDARCLTVGNDERITRLGHFLRGAHWDELPQLFNICRGELACVGPRPEVPEFVDLSHPGWRAVLAAKPGLVDPAALAYRQEAQLLASFPDPLTAYRTVILPQKLTLSQRYLAERSWASDLQQIGKAIVLVFKTGKGSLR